MAVSKVVLNIESGIKDIVMNHDPLWHCLRLLAPSVWNIF